MGKAHASDGLWGVMLVGFHSQRRFAGNFCGQWGIEIGAWASMPPGGQCVGRGGIRVEFETSKITAILQ